MRTFIFTKQQIDEINGWQSNDDLSKGGGANKVSQQGFIGSEADYQPARPATSDEIERSLTNDYFKQFGINQGRNFAPDFFTTNILNEPEEDEDKKYNEVNEEFNNNFLNKKFKASKTDCDTMTSTHDDSFVQNYKSGDISLKALRQKVYNIKHGKSSEDAETEKAILNAYSNAKKINKSNQDANNNTMDAIAKEKKYSKVEEPSKKPIIKYF